MFQLRAKAGGFIAADSGKAKEGHVKRFEDVIFHTIPLVLFCPFLMEMKSVDFYCKQRRFSKSVIKQEIRVGAVADIFLFGSGEYGKLVGGKYFSKRDVRNRAERQMGKLLKHILDEAVHQILGSELRDLCVTG